jgi:hypothetical protein
MLFFHQAAGGLALCVQCVQGDDDAGALSAYAAYATVSVPHN